MQFNLRHITHALLMPALIAVLALVAPSCSSREDEPTVEPDQTEAGMAVFTINLGDLSGRATPADGEYDAGSGLENHIDIEGGDYRMLLFSEADRLVSQMMVKTIYKFDSEVTGRNYTVIATLRPFEIDAIKAGCKVVILANWKNYAKFEAGRTTLESLCTNQNAIYSFNASKSVLSDDNLIPMYGVKAFPASSMTVEDDVYQVGTVRLLRAYAKVEVNATFKDFPISSVTSVTGVSLTNCYDAGYKVQAPEFASNEDDYVHGSWDKDYTPVHIPASANAFKLPMTLDAASGNYLVYIPEYNNLNADGTPRSADERARIRIDFQLKEGGVTYARYGFIEFRYIPATATVDVTDEDDPTSNIIDIERNNWYKFAVQISPKNLAVKVDVVPYTAVELDPGFGFITPLPTVPAEGENPGWVEINP